MDEFNQQQDVLLDSALNELPIAPLPPDFAHQVMVNVRSTNAYPAQRTAEQIYSATPIRFRLQFLDVSLALFWSLALLLVWAIVLWWTGLLRLNWLPQVQPIVSSIDPVAVANPVYLFAGIIIILLEISLLGLVGVNLLGERPAYAIDP
ncbi:MAG: hypothetical protein GWP61_10745 [Chloroflexi bacterium]|jgi:hypothetical protein|nr:hypothetical protein [Chloroflexota bacterium]